MLTQFIIKNEKLYDFRDYPIKVSSSLNQRVFARTGQFGARLAIFASFIMAIVLGAACSWWLPTPQQSREVALWEAMPEPPEPAMALPYKAEDFCIQWSGKGTASLDCRNGYLLDTMAPPKQAATPEAWGGAMQAVEARVRYASVVVQELQNELARQPNPALAQVLFHLKVRTDRWQERWTRLSQIEPGKVEQLAYAELFALLLDLHGQTYDPVRNQFRTINWHVARALDQSSALQARGQALDKHLRWAPWAIMVGTGLLLMLAWTCWGWRAWGLMIGLCTIACAGLLIVADASVRFGQGSAVFAFNPLGNQMVRQSRILLSIASLLVVTVLLAPWLRLAVRPFIHRTGWLMLALLLTMVGAYLLIGPAGGSELLKVSMALTAGLITAMHGRSIHLTTALAPRALQPVFLLRQLGKRSNTADLLDPLDLIGQHVGRPILQMAGFTALSLALAALVFNDLGASLVTACIALSSLYFVFGARITLAVTIPMVLAALLASQTAKVQARLALMVDPLTAAISDFARLVAFEQSTPGLTAGFGNIAWCNGVGACIPLQSLSDYMPVVLAGAIGRYGTVAYFLIFLGVLIALATWLVRRSLTQADLVVRTLTLTAFYLLLGTLVQTLVTFLGNWRVIPLTGLGMPLVSIGLSSFLAPALAIALMLALPRIERQGNRA